jgi:hypothetical protein
MFYSGADVWRHSGGIKGSTVFPAPSTGPPRVRRQYGVVKTARAPVGVDGRRGGGGGTTVARYTAYSLVSEDKQTSDNKSLSQAIVFQVLECGASSGPPTRSPAAA